MDPFPSLYWPILGHDVTFLPGVNLPPESEGHLYAVLVHAYFGDRIVVADIAGRGVCIPSGRIEPGETIDAAAVRETYEETGGRLHDTRRRLIGCHLATPRTGARAGETLYCPVFVADVVHFDPLPADSESRGYFLLPPEDLVDHYFMWDELIAAEFAYAYEQRKVLFGL